MTSLPIAIVVQRFGAKIRGGAEHHAALLAELLAKGQPVEILTTTAEDYRYWREGFEAGSGQSPAPNVKLRRFPVATERQPWLFSAYHRLMIAATRLGLPTWLRWPMERLWYKLQGPFCPELVDYVVKEQSQFKEIIFITYLYYPTVMAAARLTVPYRLIPTLHDEPAKDFLHTAQLLAGARTLIVNSAAEQRLIEELGQRSGKELGRRCDVVAIHLPAAYFDRPLALQPQALRPRKVEDEAYLLYVGRIEAGKGLGPLLAWYAKATFSRPVALLLAGHDQGTVAVPKGVRRLGEITDEDKMALMAGAVAVIHPSRLESLALVALEAMALGTPLLLHEGNEVFRRYIAAAPTARGFSDEPSFRAGVEALLSAPPSAAARQQGRDWVRDRFSESAIAGKFATMFADQGSATVARHRE